MKLWGKRCLIPVVGLCLVLVNGCLSGGPPTVYYTLTATSGETPTAMGTPSDLIIGVGPVSLPAYLERLPIVTRSGPNRLKIDDGQRWAGPLSEEIERVLKQNLTALTGIQRVTVYPWNHDAVPDLRVRLNVLAFEGSAGTVHLDVQWSMIDKVAGTVVDARQTRIEVPVPADDTETLVSAMSRALGTLSREIAALILDRTRPR
jgi:uncharacterized lipoprotein YmbA